MSELRHPPRVRTARHLNPADGIPVATYLSHREVGELLRLWHELRGRGDRRAARASIGRILTSRAEDV